MHVEKRNAFTFVAGHWQKKDWQKTKFNLRHFKLIQKICRSTFIFIINSPSRGVKNASRVTFFSLFVRKKRRKNGGQQCAMKARNGNASWFYEKIYSFFFFYDVVFSWREADEQHIDRTFMFPSSSSNFNGLKSKEEKYNAREGFEVKKERIKKLKQFAFVIQSLVLTFL